MRLLSLSQGERTHLCLLEWRLIFSCTPSKSGTAPPPYSQLAAAAPEPAPTVPVIDAVPVSPTHSDIVGRLHLPDGAPIIAIPQKISYSMSPLVRAYPPSLGLKYGVPRAKWLEFHDVTSAYLVSVFVSC